jgi:BirA family biotin operon repressor/biotin-[acetyl-CoA-carboxylase] ligase
LQIYYLDEVDSTQLYLKDAIFQKKLIPPCGVVANMQSAGVGSRQNSWLGKRGNLFLSFAIALDELPDDLKLESASIYFAYILKDTLATFGSSVWLKWPNDFYIADKKIGGMITNLVGSVLVCGVGINTSSEVLDFAKLDISLDREALLDGYFENIKNHNSWKQVFSKYRLEFYKNQNFFTHSDSLKISLDNAFLDEDGSIVVDGKRIYSLR